MRTTPLLAVAASAVLGLVLGTGTGVLQGGSGAGADPLEIGIPLQDQSCNGGTLVVVATGDAAPPLAAAAADEPDLRYLRTADSCATAWTEQGPAPAYVAYQGPYDTREQACDVRMSADHRGDFVTRLHDGNPTPVRCLCYQAYSSMPLLRPGLDASILDGIWIRQLQRALTDLGHLDKGHLNGFYDSETIAAVKEFQSAQGLAFNGVTNADTWHALATQACKLYQS